jgi:uncharacterized membrane protein
MAQRDSALVPVLLLTAGSLAGLIIQLSNDTTPGTGNISPVSMTCLALFVGQLIWLIAFARRKEPKDERHRVSGLIISAAFTVAMAVYLLVQVLNGTSAEVLGFGLTFIFLMTSLAIKRRQQTAQLGPATTAATGDHNVG